MHKYSDVKILPHSAVEMFTLVKDVEKYPDFLPWCEGLRIKQQLDNEIVADMLIGFKGISEKFTSRVTFDTEKNEICVKYENGPFKSLVNTWKLIDVEGGCEVHFYIEFAFKNKILDMAMTPVFTTIVEKMIKAFSSRADDLYS